MKYIIFILLSISQLCYGQADSSNYEPDWEELFESFEENENSASELIQEILDNKININDATFSEISEIPFLTESDVKLIWERRKRYSKIENISSFVSGLNIDNFKKRMLNQIFILSSSSILPAIQSIRLRSNLKFHSPNTIAEQEGKFKGSNFSNYNKLMLNLDNSNSLVVINQKDVNESKYSDYISLSVKTNKLYFNNAVFGNYQIQFGQGLALWSPYSFGKGSNAITAISKKPKGISPNSYSEENKYFSGLAITHKLSSFKISAFYSSMFRDATEYTGYYTLYNSGYHRTENELRKQDLVKINSSGGIISNSGNNYSFAMAFIDNKFSDKIKLGGNGLEDENKILSSCYSLFNESLNYSAEWAYNIENKALATIHILKFIPDRNYKFIVVYRNYSPDYYSLYSQGFGEFNSTQNERGYYFGVQTGGSAGKFDLYYDMFSETIPDENFEFPATGNEFMLNFRSRKIWGVNLELKYLHENKSIPNNDDKITSSTIRRKSNYRVTINYSKNKTHLRTRYELVNVSYDDYSKNESGYYLYQEVSFSLRKFLAFTFRATYFNTDSYASRLYSYEKDIYGAFSIPVLYQKGFRWYLLFKFSIFKKAILELKLDQLYKPQTEQLFSAENMVNSNNFMHLSIQTRIIL